MPSPKAAGISYFLEDRNVQNPEVKQHPKDPTECLGTGRYADAVHLGAMLI